MKSLLLLGCLASAALLAGCGGKELALDKPNFKGKEQVVSIVNSNWDKLITQCPALNKYSKDLSYDGLSDWTDLGGSMSRVEIKFKVSKEPKSIPNSFNAWGHTCSFGISPDGKTLRIQKELCVSVCQGKKYQGNGNDYVTSL
ncbi:hypothetical protein [Vibrio fluvialis]|uniref:hypothetical protein n=1 Tax=Vibrio fluvialis TaxID=676 RepID=UPI001302ADB0|nr:hypothetical protein [Vibrio fluvialis]